MLTTDEAFMAWGWRIGFILSVVLIGIALVIHAHVAEPEVPESVPDQAEAQKARRSPLVEAAKGHWREIVLAGGAFVANNACFYIAITYAVAYGTTTVGIDRNVMLYSVMIASALMIPTLLVCGAVSDRHGRRGIFLAGALLSGVWAFVFFQLLESGTPVAVLTAIIFALVFIAMMYGPQAALFAELFPRSVRYSGASLGYQIGATVGGGFAPIIATALFARSQSSLPISVYLAGMCAVSFASIVLLGRRAPRHTDD
jgi:MFS family permease